LAAFFFAMERITSPLWWSHDSGFHDPRPYFFFFLAFFFAIGTHPLPLG